MLQEKVFLYDLLRSISGNGGPLTAMFPTVQKIKLFRTRYTPLLGFSVIQNRKLYIIKNLRQAIDKSQRMCIASSRNLLATFFSPFIQDFVTPFFNETLY